MPKAYESIRDECLSRKRKHKGKLSDNDIQNCKKMAAITYYKKTGKPVKHADAKLLPCISDPIELDILDEQLQAFGSLDYYDEWNGRLG